MPDISGLFQSGDWAKEKHVPVIEVSSHPPGGGNITVILTVGKQVPHHNTTEHHIAWIDLYFLPEGEKFPYHVARFEFASHGASTQGPNTSSVYSQPSASCTLKTDRPGTLLVSSYCNIHGLWQASAALTLK